WGSSPVSDPNRMRRAAGASHVAEGAPEGDAAADRGRRVDESRPRSASTRRRAPSRPRRRSPNTIDTPRSSATVSTMTNWFASLWSRRRRGFRTGALDTIDPEVGEVFLSELDEIAASLAKLLARWRQRRSDSTL